MGVWTNLNLRCANKQAMVVGTCKVPKGAQTGVCGCVSVCEVGRSAPEGFSANRCAYFFPLKVPLQLPLLRQEGKRGNMLCV